MLAGQVSAIAPAPCDSDPLPAAAQRLLLCNHPSSGTTLQAVLTEMLFEAHELLEEVQDSMPDDPEEES